MTYAIYPTQRWRAALFGLLLFASACGADTTGDSTQSVDASSVDSDDGITTANDGATGSDATAQTTDAGVDPGQAGNVESAPPFTTVKLTGKTVTFDLTAKLAEVQVAPNGAKTKVWAFNGQIPGPTLRATVGDRVVINFKNELPEKTTIHWHGLRIDNAMDGVPVVMNPIKAGATFRYEFVVPDAGSFWYHPHMNTAHQVERGLYGAFVVDEVSKPTFHADDYWVIDDWHLDAQNQYIPPTVNDDFWGRSGKLITLNTSTDLKVDVKSKQIRRLRVLNGSNSSIFVFKIGGHKLKLIAKDGAPVSEPWTVDELRIAPGERWDIELHTDQTSGSFPVTVQRQNNMFGPAGGNVSASTKWTVNGKSYPKVDKLLMKRNVYTVIEVQNSSPMSHPFHMHGHFFSVMSRTVGMSPPGGGTAGPVTTVGHVNYVVGEAKLLPPPKLVPLKLPRLAPAGSDTLKIVLASGAGGGGMGGGGGGGMGGGGGGGGTSTLTLADKRAFFDTVEIHPGETVKLVMYGNNPGNWMYHCHILEHEEGGMMGVFQVKK